MKVRSTRDSWRLITELLHRMKVMRVALDRRVHNTTLGTLAKRHRWQQAVDYLMAMWRCSAKPDTVSYNTAIRACERSLQLERARALMEHMGPRTIKADVITHSTVISACDQLMLWEQALDGLQVMRLRRVAADALTFATVIRACDKGGQWEVSLSLLASALEHGMADTSVFNATMSAQARCHEWARALWLLRLMPARDLFSYTAAISGCERRGSWSLCLSILEEAWRCALPPNIIGYRSVVRACGSAANWEAAVGVFGQMQQHEVPDSDGSAVSALVWAHEAAQVPVRTLRESAGLPCFVREHAPARALAKMMQAVRRSVS